MLQRSGSEFRFEKHRAEAVVTLVTNENIKGCFFTAAGSARRDGAERIGDLLNSETGFFPFEMETDGGPRPSCTTGYTSSRCG